MRSQIITDWPLFPTVNSTEISQLQVKNSIKNVKKGNITKIYAVFKKKRHLRCTECRCKNMFKLTNYKFLFGMECICKKNGLGNNNTKVKTYLHKIIG